PGFSGPYIDGHGEYIVQFHDDREQRVAGLNSCLLRLAKPFAGKWQTGFHMPYLPGSEVAIAFFAGNPDLPYILHALHNSQDTDPVHQEHKWRTRNVVIHTVRNNTIQVEDRENQEHIKIATEPGKSQLNLGHAVTGGDQLRGIGFELRSDAKGALRAGQGLLISTEPQSKAQGQITDTSGATALFERTQAQADALAQGASASKAEIADLKAENQWLKDELTDIKKQVIALSAPHGIGLATPDRVMIGAGKDVSVATSRGFNVSAFKNVAIAAREVLSLFANTMGIRMLAAKGPVEIQAQSDVLALAAQKDVIVTSANGAVHVRADKELVLECGGAYVELKDGTITLGSAKPLQLKLPGMKKSAPEIMHLAGPAFAPVVVPFKTGCDAWLHSDNFAENTTPSGSKLVNWDHKPSQAPTPLVPAESPSNDKSEPDINPTREPKLPTTPKDQVPELIKLKSPAACDWKLRSMEREFTGYSDTDTYEMVDENKNRVEDGQGNPYVGGGKIAYAFKLKYDSETKTVSAITRIKVVPADLVLCDFSGNPILKDGLTQSIPYDQGQHGDIVSDGAIGKTVRGVAIKYRDKAGIDLVALKRKVEATLNRHHGLVILDGCSREGGCGWRVKVKFEVELVESANDSSVAGVYPRVFLFPKAKRASSGAWGEEVLTFQDGLVKYVGALEVNVLVHECMHLFGAPDEYFAMGGFVHQQYITDGKLNFKKGEELSGSLSWQILSRTNLMGYASDKPHANVSPYYIEYVRRHFSELNGKDWKVGYDESERFPAA
ncbi:type IV secretion protein Rhs, partial [Caballeronia jiangsuensis]